MPHTLEAYNQFSAERLKIEEREPPSKRLVNIQARNDECRARGFPPNMMVPLSGPQRSLGYFFTFGCKGL